MPFRWRPVWARQSRHHLADLAIFLPEITALTSIRPSTASALQTDTGLNFRLNPNNGALAGLDVAITGSAISGVAYTNSQPNSGSVSGATTLYTLDSISDQLMEFSNPPNGGVQIPVGLTGVGLLHREWF